MMRTLLADLPLTPQRRVFIEALGNDNLDDVRLLIQGGGYDPNMLLPEGMYPARMARSLEMLELLVSLGADLSRHARFLLETYIYPGPTHRESSTQKFMFVMDWCPTADLMDIVMTWNLHFFHHLLNQPTRPDLVEIIERELWRRQDMLKLETLQARAAKALIVGDPDWVSRVIALDLAPHIMDLLAGMQVAMERGRSPELWRWTAKRRRDIRDSWKN